MKRSLILSLGAVALAAMSFSAVQAQTVDVALNLVYTDPADPSEGGTWELVARVDSGLGIAAVNAILENINNGVGPDDITLGTGIGAIDPIDAGGANERPAYLSFNSGVGTDLIYGQDISAGAVASVGTGVGTPGDNGLDVFLNATWDNAALLASGTFGGLRPGFTTNGTSVTDSNVFLNVGAGTEDADTPTGGTTNRVRGDSVSLDGLVEGDANRDNVVNGNDFSLLALNFLTGTTWNEGDFNDSGTVDGNDFSLLALNFLGSRTPPAITAVPEPGTIALAALAFASMVVSRRRVS